MRAQFAVVYLREAEKFFQKHPAKISSRIFERIQLVARDPFAADTNLKKLQHPQEGYRLRIGDYRVIYLLDKSKKKLVVVKISHRSEAYR